MRDRALSFEEDMERDTSRASTQPPDRGDRAFESSAGSRGPGDDLAGGEDDEDTDEV